MSWSSSFIFKGISQRRFIFKKRSKFDYEVWLNVQSLIKKIYPLGMFWLYNFRVFDALKFVTFRKSWDHILELYAKAKSSWISQQVQFFNKKSKKNLQLYGLLVWVELCHQVPGVSDIHLIDQGRIKVWVSLEIQHPSH